MTGANRDYPWWRPGGRSPFSLDPDKPFWPQVFSAAAQTFIIFGGPIIALIGMAHYPLLNSNSPLYIVTLGSIALLFVASFFLIPARSLPKGIPFAAAMMFRAGLALCATTLWVGLFLIVNGYDSPLATRDVAVVGKSESLERDPSRREYMLVVRAWPRSKSVAVIDTTRQTFEKTRVPFVSVRAPKASVETMPDVGMARLTVGRGRLGVEWKKKIEVL